MRVFSILFALIFILAQCQRARTKPIVILISANAEWRVVKSVNDNQQYRPTPWGEYFETTITKQGKSWPVVFFHEGWGKTAAAGATQYAIDKWQPDMLVNLGTCGGFEGLVKRYEILLVDTAIIYDIREAMGDSKEAIDSYTTAIDLSWFSKPDTIRRTKMVSADRDLIPEETVTLKANYDAIAGDWETGSIAYTCARNKSKLVVLRGVSDLVSSTQGEAYGKPSVFINGTEVVMRKLLRDLPAWLILLTTQPNAETLAK
jgi:adenosylhomocysteine nucleosidase